MALEVHVVSPEREVWSGEAEIVVAKGTDGDVGILTGHAPMLVSLAVHPVRIKSGGSEHVILVDLLDDVGPVDEKLLPPRSAERGVQGRSPLGDVDG